MKVLQVIDTLKVGGAERVFVDLVNVLTRAGVHTEVLLLNEGGPLEEFLDPTVRVHTLQRVNKYSPAKALVTHKLSKKFDVVHTHMRHCYAYLRAVQLGFNGRYKLLLHDHYGDIGINKRVPLALKLPSAPRFYVGVSQELCEWAAEYVKPMKRYLLRNIIIPHSAIGYRNTAVNKALMIANVRPTKNIEFAIDLCIELGVELDIYGNKSDAEYYSYLNQKILHNRKVRIIEGVTDFSGLYNNYSFALHTAYSETGPLVLLEYMAHGIPFVSYKTGEVANVVAADLPDLFNDSFELQMWADSINRIRQKDDLPQKLQDIFRNHFSSEKYLQQCLQIYQDVAC